MKGVIFTSFLEMVETAFGYETVDAILSAETLPSGGIYTAVGTYSHTEIITLVRHLSQRVNIPIPTLLHIYGKHLFTLLAGGYSSFINGITNAFELLEMIESYIHVEVRKLYPEAELPRFETERLSINHLQMIYRSERGMAALAVGLIEGCFEHYKQKCHIELEMMNPKGTIVKINVHQI
jgi:Haem-NO-binding